ncbi:MAG: heparinase II/III family protein [Bacteroidota bacterium]
MVSRQQNKLWLWQQLRLTVVLLILLVQSANGGEQPVRQSKSIDTVPRHRLVTNQEFFSLLDLHAPQFQRIRSQLLKADSTQALSLLADYFKNRTQPRFFFRQTEFAARLKEFISLYPDEVRYLKLATEHFQKTYGADVDWRQPGKDLLGREHTPNTVRFLARQWHAEHITLTYFIERDRAYLDFLMNHVLDFLSDYEAGRAESGANDVFERFYGGHRARNWLSMHNMLLASDDYTTEDQITLVKAFLLHGARFIDVSKKFNWGNHQLVGLVALYELTTMYPEFPVMQEWNKTATAVLLEHLEKEIPPDGFQIERASHYFKLDIMNYFRVYQLSALNNIPLPKLFHERFRKMFDAIVAVAMPNKLMPVLQDAQARYQPQSNNMAELPEPQENQYMSIGAALFNDPVYKYFGDETLPPSLYWFFDRNAAARYASIPARQPTVGSVGLPDTKYYVMRTGWNAGDRYMIIDGGLAENKPDHTHGGVLGLQLYADREMLLPNYHVRYSDPSYKLLKNSLVKNVALVDTFLQGRWWRDNKARTGFGVWTKLPKPTVKHWISGEKYDYFQGSHDGFDTLGVTYTRHILFVKPDYWLVVDDFDATARHSYQQIWQGEFEIDQKNHRVLRQGKEGKFVIAYPEGEDLNIIPQQYGDKSSVWVTATKEGRARMVSILAPVRNDEQIPTLVIKGDGKSEGYRITRTEKSYDSVFFPDGGLVVTRHESGRLQSFLMVEARTLQAGDFTLSVPSPELIAGLEGRCETNGRVTIRSFGKHPQKVLMTGNDANKWFSLRGDEPVEILPSNIRNE